MSFKGFYNLLDTVKEELLSSPFVNTVSYGALDRVDINKKTIFPLAHFMVNGVTYEENILTYNISLLCMDIVDESKDNNTDVFLGNDNEQDVFNTQQAVILRVLDSLNKGDLHGDLYQLEGSPNIEPFVDRFDNRLAGWAVTLDVTVINDMTC
jgi:hypothetical protein